VIILPFGGTKLKPGEIIHEANLWGCVIILPFGGTKLKQIQGALRAK